MSLAPGRWATAGRAMARTMSNLRSKAVLLELLGTGRSHFNFLARLDRALITAKCPRLNQRSVGGSISRGQLKLKIGSNGAARKEEFRPQDVGLLERASGELLDGKMQN